MHKLEETRKIIKERAKHIYYALISRLSSYRARQLMRALWNSAVAPHVMAMAATLITILGTSILFFESENLSLEGVAAVIASAGQLIVLFWMVATFYHQQDELREQREELSLQRRSMQQQAGFEVMKMHIERLDEICSSILELVVVHSELGDVDRNSESRYYRDYHISFLASSENHLDEIIRKISAGDRQVIILAERYGERCRLIRKSLKSLDWQMEVRDAAWTDTPANELSILLNSALKQSAMDGGNV